MNEKEAREIADAYPHDNWKAYRAHGYLECFEQAKPLVKALEEASLWSYADTERIALEEALKEWKKIQQLPDTA